MGNSYDAVILGSCISGLTCSNDCYQVPKRQFSADFPHERQNISRFISDCQLFTTNESFRCFPFDYLFAAEVEDEPLLYIDLVINEFCVNNSGSVFDEFSEDPDWVELYNLGNTAINLAGYALSL
jgi:hypothetical protein